MGLQKNMIDRKEGLIYQVSPFALIWNDENYYMVAFDDRDKIIKNYRVDKMRNVAIITENRMGFNEFKKEDISNYSKTIFGMYGGNLEKVTLNFPEYLIGAIVDRFGKDIKIHKLSNGIYEVNVEVMCSNHFLGWVFSLGADVEIIEPIEVRNQYFKEIKRLMKKYKS